MKQNVRVEHYAMFHIGEANHIDFLGERVSTRMLGSEGWWIMRSHIGWGGERNIFYKGVKTSH